MFTDPVVCVETISFSSDLELFIGETTPITRPQWTRKSSRQPLPVAYVRQECVRELTIEVTFSCSDPSIHTVRLWATRKSVLPGSIGDVLPETVRFVNGVSGSVTFRVPMVNTQVVDLDHVRWCWRSRLRPAVRWIRA